MFEITILLSACHGGKEKAVEAICGPKSRFHLFDHTYGEIGYSVGEFGLFCVPGGPPRPRSLPLVEMPFRTPRQKHRGRGDRNSPPSPPYVV